MVWGILELSVLSLQIFGKFKCPKNFFNVFKKNLVEFTHEIILGLVLLGKNYSLTIFSVSYMVICLVIFSIYVSWE